MNIEEYISTGKLELYVLGQLDAKEAAEVESMALKYPRIKEELNAIEDSMERFAFSMSKTPPPGLKEKVLDKIDQQENSTIAERPFTPRSSPAKSFVWMPYFVAASVSLTILFAASTFFYWQKWKETDQALFALQQENIEIANNFDRAKNELESELQNHRNFLSVVRDPDSKRIELAGVSASSDTKVIVFWNSRTNEVFIDPLRLPTAPSDKQYQLWALEGGKPIDAGLLTSSQTGSLQKMKNISAAHAFAITLEKKGGSPTPNLEALTVMGKI